MNIDKKTYNRAATMRQWVQRRHDKGSQPSADEIWERIKTSWPWPMLTVEQQEYIFQHSTPRARRRKAKAVVPSPPKPATALANFKETVKSMSTESPPPGFRPAIPLREAIDTVNSYALEEGEALALSISKRGRLKVEYKYGG